MNKQQAMEDLTSRAAELAANVCLPGQRVVWGEGALDARIVVVGEAPGDKEEKLGRPFVGPGGSLLDRELELAGIDRRGIWVTNVVKCRPTRETHSGLINRTPTVKEVHEWAPVLEKELDIINPEVIVCLGAVAANALIHGDFRITRERGRWFPTLFGPRTIATYHPAYLLRQVGPSWDSAIEEFRSDLRMIADEGRLAA